MSRANVDLIRDGFEAFRREGLDGIIQLFDPRVEVLTPINPEAQRLVGHDELRRSLEDQFEAFDDWELEPVEFEAVGEDVVVVSVRQRGRGRGSGVTVQASSAWLFTVRDGKAVRLALHRTKADALAEARSQSLRQ